MGLWVTFNAVKNNNRVRKRIEKHNNWFLIDWCKNNLGLSQNDYDEGTFSAVIEKPDIIKLKEDCLNCICDPSKYPEYFDFDKDADYVFAKLAEIVYVTYVLLSLDLEKYTVDIDLTW